MHASIPRSQFSKFTTWRPGTSIALSAWSLLKSSRSFASQRKSNTSQQHLPFAVSLAINERAVNVFDFSTKLHDPDVLGMARKITCSRWHDSDFPRQIPGWVRIKTIDGRTFEHKILHTKGSPDNPLSADEVTTKFVHNAEGVLTKDQVETVIDSVFKLEKLESIGQLTENLAKR
jgi:2-methylcitrate dehydratase PrpD